LLKAAKRFESGRRLGDVALSALSSAVLAGASVVSAGAAVVGAAFCKSQSARDKGCERTSVSTAGASAGATGAAGTVSTAVEAIAGAFRG